MNPFMVAGLFHKRPHVFIDQNLTSQKVLLFCFTIRNVFEDYDDVIQQNDMDQRQLGQKATHEQLFPVITTLPHFTVPIV
jgi:hypothetical protein